MLLASYFSLPSSLSLIDPLKRGTAAPFFFVSLDFYRHGTSSFLCRVQGWIIRLEHKTLFHGTPTMHLWTPCYAWTTDADPHPTSPPPLPQRDSRAASEGPVDPGVFGSWGPLFPVLPGFPQDRKSSSDKDCFHLVITMTLCYLVHL